MASLGPWSVRWVWCVVALAACGALAQVPGETKGDKWCSGPKTCVQWTPVPSAASYNVYRGTATTLPDLLTTTPDSCLVGNFPGTTTGTTILAVPPPGKLHWYLVTAANGSGEGTSGNATAGPRKRESFGPCGATPVIVINEVDYDEPGTDTNEFVEIYNPSAAPVDLTGLALVFINGPTQTEYARVDLDTGSSRQLMPGAYLVVATSTVSTPPATNVILFPAASNNVQNGSPDGIALFDTETNTLVDALSYEGSITAAVINGAPGAYNLVEGTATSVVDGEAFPGSLNRMPNGSDTNDAATDWELLTLPSPGAPNGTGGVILINEVDYDQPLTDADEFVELYNPSTDPVNLTGLVLVFINGATQTEYLRIDLTDGSSSQLLGGEYLVVATATVSTPPGTNKILFPATSNNVQNGAPDGIALFDTASDTLLDALSYEGSINAATIIGAPGTHNLVEGTPEPAPDSNALDGSLSRVPNGSDTNDADTDWSFVPTPTPGSAN